MGNSFGRKRSKIAKVMKINGETFKFRTPIRVGSVVANHPGHVLLESEAVRYHGVRAKPLEPRQELQARRVYFLVELPESADVKALPRTRSGLQVTAQERLERLMAARRSNSDSSVAKRMRVVVEEEGEEVISENRVRVKMRLPKAEVKRLMAESENELEVGEKIFSLYAAGRSAGSGGDAAEQKLPSKGGHAPGERGTKRQEKQVRFSPVEMETHPSRASYSDGELFDSSLSQIP